MSETSLPPYSPELFLFDLKEKETKSIDEALSFMMDVVNYVLLRASQKLRRSSIFSIPRSGSPR